MSIIFNQKLLYNLMFSAASDSLITLCKDKKYMGALPGIVSVLHTWGQKLNFHPHLHVMLTGGGLKPDGRFVITKHKGFIIPIKVLGEVFRGKFLDKLKQFYTSERLVFSERILDMRNSLYWKDFINDLYETEWLPFIKETFNGNGNAVEYLARYAYRTAISNSRLECVSTDHVTIKYTDYSDGNQKKLLMLEGSEFIRLFLQHILPPGFHRVRFNGFLSNCNKARNLKLIGDMMRTPYNGNPLKGKNIPELLITLYGTDICSCPVCHQKLKVTHVRYIHPPGTSSINSSKAI